MASELGVQTIQHTNGTDAMTIDSSGYVTLSNPVSFLAYSMSTDSNNGALVFINVQHNVGNCYSTSTGKFTAPVKGVYHFGCAVLRNTGDANVYFRVDDGTSYLTGNSTGDRASQYLQGSTYTHASPSINLQLNASQTVSVFVGTTATVWSNYNYFTGHLITPVA